MKLSSQGKKNNKQHYQVSFSVPSWLLTPFTIVKYQYKKLKFWLNPFHCDVCGKRQYVQSPQYEITFSPGNRLTVHNHRMIKEQDEYKSVCICRECMVKELETKEWTPRFTSIHNSTFGYEFWNSDKCAVTGTKVTSYKDVEIMPYIDMTFCTIAWNHDYVSKQAVIDCVKKGKVTTAVFAMVGNKMVAVNGEGIPIDDQGNLL